MKKNKETDLSMLKNITSLEELVIFDNRIRAFTKCKVKEQHLVDDMVNDAYIKLDKYMKAGKVINGGYVVMTITNIYLNHIKHEKRYTAEFITFKYDRPDDSMETYEEKLVIEEDFTKMYDLIDEKLKWFERKILELSYLIPITELSRRSKIPYASLIYTKNKINKKLNIKKNK